MADASVRVGIDVGGTNTDAVTMAGDEIRGAVKVPTTPDVTSGVVSALGAALADSGSLAADISHVMIGTTHFTNALLEARHLSPTAVVRIAPLPLSIPPMADWPLALREAVEGQVYQCAGGHEYDGRSIVPLDVAELERIAADIRNRGLTAVAVTSVFSPVNPSFELAAGRILRNGVPEARITLSHQLGTVGLLERENATVLNSCLQDLASRVVRGFSKAVASQGVTAATFLSQNDGTLMSASYAQRFPVAAIASGPTNSMRGAAFLSGLKDCIVVDIGGTTSDIGVLRGGFPREASSSLRLAGVRTSFRMPDVLSVALGGGSIVGGPDGAVTVGPLSVGYELTKRARVFGGETVTATDVAVAAGQTRLGDPEAAARLRPDLVRAATAVVAETLATALDQVKTTRESLPVVAVGGGSFLIGSRIGDLAVVRPDYPGVANAIGAAIAEVGGEVDRVFSLHNTTREEVLALAAAEARTRAIEAGARPETVQIADREDIPLTHVPEGTALRVRVKAVGTLDLALVTRAAD